jgi:hypothetical protein
MRGCAQPATSTGSASHIAARTPAFAASVKGRSVRLPAK